VTTTRIMDSITEKYNDCLRRDSPFMSVATKIIHKAKKNTLTTLALKTLMSDKLVDRRPSGMGRSFEYYLLKKGKNMIVEKIFPYDIRKTLDLLISENAPEYLDREAARKYLSSGEEDGVPQRRPVGRPPRDRTNEGTNITGPSKIKKKGEGKWSVDRVVAATSTSASNGHHTAEVRTGKRRRDSELEEELKKNGQNGSREGRNTVEAKNALESTRIQPVSRRVALTPAERAAKAERIMNSDQPYGRVPLSDIALFFVTGALGCRLVARALQVQCSSAQSTLLMLLFVFICHVGIVYSVVADQSAADYVANLNFDT
jgi:hypothetical protein